MRPGCSIIRASLPFANIGVLRAGRAQPLYLLTPPGRFGPSAQVPTGHTLPSGAPAGRFALRATAHRADASLRCAAGRFGPLAQVSTGHTLPSGAPSPVPQHKKRALRVPEGHKKRASLNPSLNISANGAAILHPEGPRRLYFKKHYHLERPAFLASLRSLATLDGLCRRKRRRPPLIPASSRVSCSLRSLATLTAFAAAEVFGALPQTPARA